jgi:hypothetical protein
MCAFDERLTVDRRSPRSCSTGLVPVGPLVGEVVGRPGGPATAQYRAGHRAPRVMPAI